MKVLWFAWLRTRTGVAEEDVSPPAEVADVAGLIDWLRQQSPGHAEALRDNAAFRVAVNLEHVQTTHPVGPDDEVAFFPPVTGG